MGRWQRKFKKNNNILMVGSDPRANYVPLVARHLDEFPPTPGEVNLIDIMHDDWCGVFSRKPCNCNPIIRDG
jgi:hypothetical protein